MNLTNRFLEFVKMFAVIEAFSPKSDGDIEYYHLRL